MVTEIPREPWVSLCRAFSRQHGQWLISVGEVITALAVGDEPLDGPGVRLLRFRVPAVPEQVDAAAP